MSRRTLQFQPWAECYVCGEDHPQDEMVRHVRFKQLVDRRCADELGYEEVFAKSRLPTERVRVSERVVRNQGQVTTLVSPYLEQVLALGPSMLLDYSNTSVVDLTGNFTPNLVGSYATQGIDPSDRQGALDLSGGYMYLTDNLLLNPALGEMTFETWFRGAPTEEAHGLFHKSGVDAADGYFFATSTAATQSITTNIDDLASLAATRNMESWKHFIATITRVGINVLGEIYIDNTSYFGPSKANVDLTNAHRLLIGASVGNSSFVNSSDDEPDSTLLGALFGTAIYPFALSPGQIASNFKSLRQLVL